MKRVALALALVAVLATGCGDEEKSDADQVKDALTGYYAAIADGDVEKACEHVGGTLVPDCPANAKRLAADREGAEKLEENTKALIGDKEPVIRGDLACIPVSTQSIDFQKLGEDWVVIRLGRDLEDRADCAKGLTAP